MRKRSTVLSVPNETVHCQSNTSTLSAVVGTWQEKSIEDIQTPDFSRLLKCGKFLPLNPTVITTRSETLRDRKNADIHLSTNPVIGISGSPSAFYGYTWGGLTPSGRGSPQLPVRAWQWPEVVRDDALVDLCVIAARSNVYAERWDILTFLGELGATVQMFGQLASRFWAAMQRVAADGVAYERAAKRARKQSAKERLKGGLRRSARRVSSASRYVQENWLLARYGIRPLLYDVQDIVRTVKSILEERDANLVVGRGRQNKTVRDTMFTTYNSPYSGAAVTNVSWEDSVSEIYRSACYLELEGRWRELFQTDLLVTGWELTRLSFVFDWFVNVGAWLQGLTPQLKGDFAGTVCSIRASNVRSAIFTMDVGPKGVGTPGEFYWEKRIDQYVRFAYTGVPYPRLNLRLNWAKIADLVALNRRGRSDFYKVLSRR